MRLVRMLTMGLLAGALAFAQHDHKPQATLMSGLGNVHHPVTTSNPEAQKFFDQGFALIYGFNHDEAERSFRRAAELDPNMAMAFWGIAKAVGPNYNLPVDDARARVAFENIQKARSLSPKASPPERAYIDALAKLYTDAPKPDYRALMTAYADSMRALSKTYPDDLDAATLYAESLMNLNPWSLWSKDGTPWQQTPEILATLRSVLKRDPNHIGANHLYIHAIEASPNPEDGLSAANRLAGLAPNAGHLVHMPAHIFIRTGDYAQARKTNVSAAQVDEAYIKASGAQGIYPLMYYSHNLHFVAHVAAREGRYTEAKQAADKLAAHIAPHLKDMPDLQPFVLEPTAVLLRFERWEEILRQPAPDPSLQTVSAFWHYARGMALAGTGKLDAAAAEQAKLAAAVEATAPDTVYVMPFNNKARNVLSVARDTLAGHIGLARRDFGDAIRNFRSAVTMQDSLNYGEPPDWYYPVRESLGKALMAKGDYQQAEEVFRADLQQNPRNGRSLYGLAQALKAQGRSHDEFFVRQQFEAAWKDADTRLDSMEVARASGGR